MVSIIRGDNKSWVVTVYDGDDTVDLTGASIVFSVRENESAPAYTFQRKTTLAGGGPAEVEDSALPNGEFKVHVIPINTTGETPGDFVYDIEVTTSGSKVYTVSKGKFKIKYDITYT